MDSGYWQIAVHPESRKYTAFTTPEGETLQFRVMPFGLKNATATLRRPLMFAEVLTGDIREFCFACLDDVISYLNNWKKHLEHPQRVLERLELHGMTCKLSKSYFGKSSIDYLGHFVSPEGNFPQQNSLPAIEEADEPTNKRQLWWYLGWEQRQAFKNLKASFANIGKLYRPQGDQPLILQTDACQNGLGAVLYQQDENGHPNVIAYASTQLYASEQSYHINEQECLVVIWAMTKYLYYLEEQHFILWTDSKALQWLHESRNAKAKLGRWDMFLTEYNFEVQHCPGKTNDLPDGLSCFPTLEEKAEKEEEENMSPLPQIE
ncbi:hypothetical protein PR048_006062 [Dryococelus australis]|uniref:Reverse transcriptase RNase H-like domain-containing protein n=1 Tax=Dryococelus australis TaxID=614101 RepID=A0ABQ9I9X9_9NEOP|nr:hypothetical protein PR048_006062 [Dryococelus australis]